MHAPEPWVGHLGVIGLNALVYIYDIYIVLSIDLSLSIYFGFRMNPKQDNNYIYFNFITRTGTPDLPS